MGTPKGRLGKLEARLLQQPWQQARTGVEVKLLPEQGETYVLAHSRDRAGKERAMRNRRLRLYLASLHKLRLERKQALTRDGLLQALGAAASQAGRDARLVSVTVPAEGQPVTPATFHCRVNRPALRRMRQREGRYLLRTNLEQAKPAVLWERYMQLVQQSRRRFAT